MSASKCVNAYIITIIFEFPSEEGDVGPFAWNKILWLYTNFVILSLVFLLFDFCVETFCLIDMSCTHYKVLLSKWCIWEINFCVKFEYVLSDPIFAFVFKECDIRNNFFIQLNSKQVTLVSR